MSVASKLQTLAQNLTTVLGQINVKLNAKGVDSASTLTDVSAKIEAIDTGINPTDTIDLSTNGIHNVKNYEFANVAVPVGLDTSDATATAADMAYGKTGYVQGVKVTGSVPEKDDTNLSVSANTVTVPAGIYRSQTTKSVPVTSQATPSVAFNTTTGNVTVTATQSAGYVASGSKTVTYESIPKKTAQTYVPGVANQSVAAGQFLTGAQTILGDPNLIAANIASGVTLFSGTSGEIVGTHGGSASTLNVSEEYDVSDYGSYGSNALTISYPSVSGEVVGIIVYGEQYYDRDLDTIVSFTAVGNWSLQCVFNGYTTDSYGNYASLDSNSCTLYLSGQNIWGPSRYYHFVLLTM